MANSAASASEAPTGDTSAHREALVFDAIYRAHFDFAWRALRGLGVPERNAEDAVQDVFIVVHRRLAEFQPQASLRSWLFAIIRRVASDYRRRARRKGLGDELPAEVPDTAAETPRASAEKRQALALLLTFLQQLPEPKREVFLLVEIEQMTVPQVAETLSLNTNTVYSRLRAARREFERAIRRQHARQGREGAQ